MQVYLGQLSLAIHLRIGAISTTENLEVNKHTAKYTSLVSMVWLCKLVSG